MNSKTEQKKIFNELLQERDAANKDNILARQECENLRKEITETQKLKKQADERSQALSSEVLALRHCIVQMSKEKFGV